jgi:hypothetical protein
VFILSQYQKTTTTLSQSCLSTPPFDVFVHLHIKGIDNQMIMGCWQKLTGQEQPIRAGAAIAAGRADF